MKCIVTGALLAAALATSANASMITETAFSIAKWNAATANAYATETFETIGANRGVGPLADPLETAVGVFSAIGPSGNAGTCGALDPTNACRFLALSNIATFGQGNAVPGNGKWSLNSNDNAGIAWTMRRKDGGTFGKSVFTLTDAADVRNNVLRMTTADVPDPQTFDLGQYRDRETNIFTLRFSAPVTEARIEILTLDSASNPVPVTNDSMAFDGAALAPIPLPAAGWILLSGIAGLVAVRRVRRSA